MKALQSIRKLARTLLLAGLLSAIASPATAASGPLKVGTNAGFAAPLEVAVAEAKKQGLDVKLIEFTDPVSPNVTLANGEIDLNYFQHSLFLDVVKKERGLNLEPVAIGIVNKTGLYSKKYQRLQDLPNGARVALAGDPVNFARGLHLLQDAGLLKLKPGVGPRATLNDIIDNPRQLKLLEIDFHQLPLAVNEVDLAHGFTHFLLASGVIDPKSALHWESESESRKYGIHFVAHPKSKDDPRVAQFVAIYQNSPAVRAELDKRFGDLYFRLWEKN